MNNTHNQSTEANVPFPGFGRIVSTRMKELGLTIDELANALEIHPNRVWDYAAGKGRAANPAISRRLAQLLQVHTAALNTEEDHQVDEAECIADRDAQSTYIKYPKFQRLMEERMGELGISQSELARRCRVSHTAIAKYLSGKTLPSDPRVQDALIETLGFTATELFSEQRSRSKQRGAAIGPHDMALTEKSPYLTRNPLTLNRFEESKYRQERIATQRLEEELTQHIQFAARQRRDVEILPYAKPIGPLIRYRPDLLVVSDNGMELAVEIRSGIFKVEFLAGIALNWRMATKGEVPLFVILMIHESLIPEYNPEDLQNWTHLHPLEILKRDGYIAGYAVVGDHIPDDIPAEIRMETLKAQITEILQR